MQKRLILTVVAASLVPAVASPAEDDPVGVGDQLLELEPLDDGGIGGARHEQGHEQGANQPCERLESKHCLNLEAPEPRVKRSAPHDLD